MCVCVYGGGGGGVFVFVLCTFVLRRPQFGDTCESPVLHGVAYYTVQYAC